MTAPTDRVQSERRAAASGRASSRAPLTFGAALLARRTGMSPLARAVSDEQQALTFSELRRRTAAVAAELRTLGVAEGSVAAIIARNSVDTVVAYFASWELGAVIAPLNYRQPVEELGRQLALLDPAVVLVDERGFERGVVAAPVLPIDRPGELHSRAAQRARRLDTSSGHPAAVFFTSGTTGSPKAVLVDHLGLARNCKTVTKRIGLGEGDRFALATPLCHVGGLVRLVNAVYAGAATQLASAWDPALFARATAALRPTHTMLVGAMLSDILSLSANEARALESLRLVYYGAGRTNPALIEELAERHPHLAFAQGWGATETAGSVTMLTPADHVRALAGERDLLRTAGRALPGVELRIASGVDAGSVAVRCPGLTPGLLLADRLDRRTEQDGWLVTDDMGSVDGAGYLRVDRRRDDAIRSGGLTVIPARVEDVLVEQEGVADAAVLGLRDDRLGEIVGAVVVGEAELDVGGLRDALRSRLAGFEVPRHVVVVDALPRTAAGKVDRAAVRSLLEGRT